MYMQTLAGHPNLQLVGAYDRDPVRLEAFSRFYKTRSYSSLEALLGDKTIGIVVNLTNPRSHFEVSRAALDAGYHVYSEKPLAITMEEARALVALAAERGRMLAAAPCNHLGEAVQTLARQIRAPGFGRVVLAMAEMDDGMVSGLDYANWRSAAGAPWPAKDEFEIGCTMEHAGYQISPLVMLFGPVRRVTAFNATLLPEKGRELGVGPMNPDLSVGLLEFDGGIVARLTSSIVAPHNRMLRIIGTDAVATLTDVWEFGATIRWSATGPGMRARAARKLEVTLSRWLPGILIGRGVRGEPARKIAGGRQMDFARGIAQLALQVEEASPERMGPALALHVTEVTLALQSPEAGRGTQIMTTTLPASGEA